MKSKLTPQRIAEINREITQRFGKPPISSFRFWADDVIARLKNADDRLIFEAILWSNYADPEMVEYRNKREISFEDIEDELLVANDQIPTPLNVVQLRWLREWFANNNDEVTISTPGQPTIAVEVETPTSTHDFSHMESFSQKITFDLSEWYNVLRNEGVIIGIDEAFFCDCISHAHMNELFKNGKTAKLKCAIHHIKNGYEPRWFDVVCINLGVSKQEMGKFNLGKKRKEFEQKLPF